MNTKFIEVECGKYAIDNGKLIIEGDSTDNGWCFKNYAAWKHNEGVIYIGEYQLMDYENGDCQECELWTRESWIEWVRNEIADKYSDYGGINEILACDDFISGIAYDCFEWCDWQDLTTMFYEFDYNDDWLLDNWIEWKNRL